MVLGLYDILESLIRVRYQRKKLPQLQEINTQLDILRYQTRILLDFELISTDRFGYAGKLINGIGTDLGGWMKQQRQSGASQS